MSVPGHLLLRPGCLAAMAVLAVNDHWLKGWLGPDPRWGPVTGKVSDVAGLVFFPLLLVSLVSLVSLVELASGGRPRKRRQLARAARERRVGESGRVLLAAVVVTGVGFAAIKVVPPAAATYCGGLAALRWVPAGLVAMCTAGPRPPLPSIDHVMDASDCLCLPALWLSHRIGRR